MTNRTRLVMPIDGNYNTNTNRTNIMEPPGEGEDPSIGRIIILTLGGSFPNIRKCVEDLVLMGFPVLQALQFVLSQTDSAFKDSHRTSIVENARDYLARDMRDKQ